MEVVHVEKSPTCSFVQILSRNTTITVCECSKLCESLNSSPTSCGPDTMLRHSDLDKEAVKDEHNEEADYLDTGLDNSDRRTRHFGTVSDIKADGSFSGLVPNRVYFTETKKVQPFANLKLLEEKASFRGQDLLTNEISANEFLNISTSN